MADHDRHDPLLVAGLVDRDLTDDDARDARELVARCADCAALHADLLVLASATHALPAATRPRDFRLRPSDAARLRPNRLRRLLGLFGTTPATVRRPLGAGLATIGLVGILIGTAPAVLPSGDGGAEAGTMLVQQAPAASEDTIQLQGEGDAGREATPGAPAALDGAVPASINLPIVAVSLVLLVLGAVLVVGTARRGAGRGNRAPPPSV